MWVAHRQEGGLLPRFCKSPTVSSTVIQAVGSGRRGSRMITRTGGAAPTASPLAHYPDDTPHHAILPTRNLVDALMTEAIKADGSLCKHR
jgi:hypothetical protein